jgi:hypothetical protein
MLYVTFLLLLLFFQVGYGVADISEIVRDDQMVMQSLLVRSASQFVEEYRRYSRLFADFLAIGGFEFCARNGRCVHYWLRVICCGCFQNEHLRPHPPPSPLQSQILTAS